jgi:hypothetical protein
VSNSINKSFVEKFGIIFIKMVLCFYHWDFTGWETLMGLF